MRTFWLTLILAAAPVAWSKKPVPQPAPAPAPAPVAPVQAPEGEGETPARIAEYRHEVMEAAGGHTKALFMIIKGESKRTSDILAHAQALDAIAGMTPELFPAGSGPDHAVDTTAKPEVWTKAAEFAAVASNFRTKTSALVEAAKGTDLEVIRTALFGVGGACGDCHDKFRVDEDHH